MLGRIYHVAAIFAIAHLLALVGFVGYLVQSGRLSPERAQEISELLRNVPAEEEETTEDETEAPAEEGTMQTSAEAIAAQREAAQLRGAALDRAERDLAAQRQLLERMLADQMRRTEQFREHVNAWKKRKEELRNEARDGGFQRELEYFSKLPPKQAKTVLLKKWQNQPADAVRLLNAVKTSVGQSILEQMKTEEEAQIMYELLEQLGRQDIDRFVQESGMTPDQP